jgi:hypothetical protein
MTSGMQPPPGPEDIWAPPSPRAYQRSAYPNANPGSYPDPYASVPYPNPYAAAQPNPYAVPPSNPYAATYPNPYGYPAPPQQTTTSVGGLALALRVLFIVSVFASVLQFYAWWHEYILVGDLQTNPGSVTLAEGQAADNLATLSNGLWLLLYLAIVVVFLVWFFRARQNAGKYNTYAQRHSQGWSIGGWFCPLISLVYPYQMTVDILRASESSPGSRLRSARPVTIVAVWWLVWLLSNVLELIARAVGSDTLSAQRSRDAILAASAITEGVAAILIMVIVARISDAQQRRQSVWH